MKILPSLGSWAKCSIVAAVLVWLSFLLLISNGVFHQEIGDASRRAQALRCDQLNDQLTQLHIEQRALKEENSQLKRLALSRNFQPADDELMHLPVVKSDSMAKNGLKRVEPMKVAADERLKGQLYSKDHEVSRRRMDTLLWETFFYLDKQLEDVKPDKIKGVQKHIKNQMITLLTQSSNLGTKVDQASEWHKRALEKLTRRIQNTLHKLQHPSDCSKAKILLCDLNKGCGFGCQLHHVTYCLMVAAASQRTMILEKDGTEWRYSRNGWNSVFLPLTNCSFEKETANGAVEAWSGLNQAARVVRLPIVDGLVSRPEQMPLSFPKQFADVLLTHHSNPPVFFVAQFLWYLMQDTDQMKKVVEEAEKKIPFDKGTIIGLQIRRTDKVGTEAAFHKVDEYIKWAELMFQIEERRYGFPIKRRVFVATDDPQAVAEIKEKYKDYDVYFNDGIAQTAQLSNRYTDASLYGVITDIRILSKCNYLVCTFSSQVCRMGYELMQVLNGDMADQYHSLDDIYYFGGQLAHDQVAAESYKAENSNEIDLKTDDVIGIAGNHWDGYSKGINRRTGQKGLYPSHTVKEKWRIVDFPIFNTE